MSRWSARPRTLAALALLLGTLALAACGGSDDESEGAPAPGTTAAASSEPIVLGVVAGLTGGSSGIGVPYVDAVEFAAEEINAAGGVNGRRIELIVEDNETKPVEGVQAALKLVNADKVDAVLCSCWSTILFPIMEAFESKDVVVMNNASTTPAVRDLPGNLVSAMGTDDLLGAALAEFAHGLGYEKMGILTVNDPYGTAFQDVVKETFESLGGEIAVEVVVDGSLPDYRPELRRIVNADVDAIFAGTYANDLRLQFRQLTQLGWKGTAFNLYPSATELNLDAEANDRLYGVEPTWLADDPRGEEWKTAFEDAVGKTPDFWHAVGYDAAYLAAFGVGNAASSAGDDVRGAIRDYTGEYSGPTGPIELDEKFIRTNPQLAFFKLEAGKYVRVTEEGK